MSMIQLSGTVTSLNNTADYELIGDTVISQSVDMTDFTGSFNVADGSAFSLTVYPAFSGTLNVNTFSGGGVAGTIHYLGGLGTEKFNIADGKLICDSVSANFSGVISGTGKFAFSGSSLTVTGDAFGNGVNAPFSGNVALDASQTLDLKYIITDRTWDSDDYLRKRFGVEGSGTIAVPWFSYETNGGRNGPYFLMGDLTSFTGTIQGAVNVDAAIVLKGATGDNILNVDGFVSGWGTGYLFFSGITLNSGTAYGSNSRVYFRNAGSSTLALFGCGRPMQYLEGVAAYGSVFYGGPDTAAATGPTHAQYTAATDFIIGGGTSAASVFNAYAGGNAGTVFGNTRISLLAGGTASNLYGGGNTGPVTGNTHVVVDGGVIQGAVYGGGQASSATVADTGVEIRDGSFNGIVCGGGNAAPVTGNTLVSVSGGTFSNNVFGGGNSAPSGVGGTSQVSVTGGVFSANVYGGGNYGTVSRSVVTVDAGSSGLTASFFGGGNNGAVSGDSTVFVHSGTLSGLVFGGGNYAAVAGTAKVVVNGGVLNSAVFGGGEIGTSGRSEVEINGGTFFVNAVIHGGGNAASAACGASRVVINAGSIDGMVFGGGEKSGVSGTAALVVNGGVITGSSTLHGGGNAASAACGASRVVINAGSIDGMVFGGGEKGTVNGTSSIEINGGTLSAASALYGGGNAAEATCGNAGITINAGYVAGEIYGGGEKSGVSGTSSVSITGGTLDSSAVIYGGGNTGNVGTAVVSVSGGTVAGEIFGGGRGSASSAGSVEIDLSGGEISGNVTGGGAGTVGSVEIGISGTATVEGDIFAGGRNVTGDTLVAMTGGTAGSIYAGSERPSSTGGTSTISISGGTVAGAVYGSARNEGYQTGVIQGDSIIHVSGGTVNGIFYSDGASQNTRVGGTTYAVICGGAEIVSTVNGEYYKTGGSAVTYGDLYFDDYEGEFAAAISGVNSLTLNKESILYLHRSVVFGPGTDAEVRINLDGRRRNALRYVLAAANDTVANSVKNIAIEAGTSTLSGFASYFVGGEMSFSDAELAAIRINGSPSLPSGWRLTRAWLNNSELYFTNAATELVRASARTVMGVADDNDNAVTILHDATVSGNVYGGDNNIRGEVNFYLVEGSYGQVIGGGRIAVSQALGNVRTHASGGTMTRLVAGHAVINAATASADRVELLIEGNVDGSQASGAWNYGTGMVGQGATLELECSSVVVRGTAGSAGNIVLGGRVEGSGEIAVNRSEAFITSTVATVAAGSYLNISGTASVDEAYVSLQAGAGTVLGGGIVISGATFFNVGSVTLDIGGAVSNAVFAGSYLLTRTGEPGSSYVRHAVLNFSSGSSAENGIYGGDYVSAGNGTVANAEINLNTGNSTACVFGGGYATGGTSLVENAVITVGENFTLDGNIYAGGYANGGSVEVESARIVFAGSNIFSSHVFASGHGAGNSVGSASLSFDAYRGTFAGRLEGDFDGISISNDSSVRFASADLSAALSGKSGLLNIEGDTSPYGSGSLALIFVLSAGDALTPDQIRVNGSALTAVSVVDDYCYAWNGTTRDLWVVGADNIGDFSSYYFYTIA